MEQTWRLILDGKNDGYYNMAVDEAILLNYPHLKIPTLRIYGWNKPFITLGYNQNPENVLYKDIDILFVRRITGGSAILHDKELTYSISCCLDDLNLPKGVRESYRIICSFLKSFYRQIGLRAHFAIDTFSGELDKYKNFCFASKQRFDLMINEKKIGGNAQRRKKDIIFQHGSIPQDIDLKRINKSIKNTHISDKEITSLDESLGKKTDFGELEHALAESFQQDFGIKLTKMSLFDAEEKMRDFLINNKYSAKEWNLKNAEASLVE